VGDLFKSSCTRLDRKDLETLDDFSPGIPGETSGVADRLELKYSPISIGGILRMDGQPQTRLELNHSPIPIGVS
jgi:hypothetical protein